MCAFLQTLPGGHCFTCHKDFKEEFLEHECVKNDKIDTTPCTDKCSQKYLGHNQPESGWEKRFDEEFRGDARDGWQESAIIFIKAELAKARKDLAQRVEQCLDGEDCYETPEDERKEVLRILREEAIRDRIDKL